MLSFSQYPKQIYINYDNYPASQRLQCQSSDTYKYVRQRLGHQIVTSNGDKFGPYLYRNTRNNVLIASWDKPTNKSTYTVSDIGMGDYLIYYKNE
jgi:hypothetical protein